VILALIVAIWTGLIAQAPKEPSLQELYERHSWFELREAIAGKTVSPLYAGAVASAFNRTREAESYLTRAVREAATVEAATEAREALASLYMRLGRSSDMMRVLDEALAAAPSRSDMREARAAFESFRRAPNQTARTGQHRPFRCEVDAGGVVLPAVVNGKPVNWLFDSGFSHSAMSESEAHMLGIPLPSASISATDFAGGTARTRTAIAERMTIGDAELRHVPVLVFPDSQPPWNEHQPGRRGTIGLPVALALQSIRWTRDGTCQLGSSQPRTRPAGANLAFDGETPVIQAAFSGRPLDLIVDTGNQGGSQLWERFAREFPQVVGEGRKSTKMVHQIGGSEERQIVTIPELRLRIGEFDSVLRPANVFSKPIGNDLQHGILGMDVWSQANEVTIDFQTMTLNVR
jgi:predicted aspartyl protease